MLAIGREGVNETALFHVEQCGKRQNIKAGPVAELPGHPLLWSGSCCRPTRMCSCGFPVEAPQIRVCRLALRPGPARRHPQERNDTSRLISFLGRERGG